MIATLTVFCVGPDRSGQPTHDRTVVADLGVDAQVGIVLLPSAQQRGNPRAGRPRAFGADLECLVCGDKVRVGKPPYPRLRALVGEAHAAGVSDAPLQALRA